MNRNLIRKAWLSYLERVVPKGAGVNQIKETRLAFYGGANALFITMINSLEPGQEETDADLLLMEEIDAELRAFQESL